MTLRSILVLLDGGPNSGDAIATAVRIGQAFSAYVEVLHVETPVNPYMPVFSAGDGMGASIRLIDDLAEDARARHKRAKDLFQMHCIDAGLTVVEPGRRRGEGPSFCWHAVTGHDNPELARRGRVFDLIVLARPDAAEGGVDSAALEAALFDTGRPVLIAGDQPPVIDGAHMVVAWDGSREASRSVGAALPLLKRADRVTVVSVTDTDADADGGLQELVLYLDSHGIASAPRSVRHDERAVAEALHQEIRACGADLTVMGAFGHSVISEFLFGGVTRDMLKDGKLALFLAH